MSQLAADVEGTIDEAVVGRYYTGRAEASSFTVADRAVEGRAAEALEALRWSLSTGVAPVLITSALAQGVRAIGKLSSARGGRPADLARELGMPPWKIDRVRQQMRGWTPDGVAVALRAVAEADAGVKGGGDDPEYALEKAVVAIARAARSRAEPSPPGPRYRSPRCRPHGEPARPREPGPDAEPAGLRPSPARHADPRRPSRLPDPREPDTRRKPRSPSWGRTATGVQFKQCAPHPRGERRSACERGVPVRSGREGPLGSVPAIRSREFSPGGRQPWRPAPTSCWRRGSCG